MKILFLLLSSGPSHILEGIHPVKGLKKLGINATMNYPALGIKPGFDDPDYVFCLKPRESDELILRYKRQGAKIALIMDDETLPVERMKIYDFLVTASISGQKYFQKIYSQPCYLFKEEWDYFISEKRHVDTENPTCVTMGFHENLKKHLTDIIIREIKSVYQDFTAITNNSAIARQWCKDFRIEYKEFPKSSIPSEYSKTIIDLLSTFDVGIITQYAWNIGRSSNRLKAMLYAGLPVIAMNTENHANVWFNNAGEKVFLVKKPEDWKNFLIELKSKEKRQEITDYNLDLVRKNGGVIKSAESFLEAIQDFEKGKIK